MVSLKKGFAKKIAVTACMAALVCVATYALALPLPIGGYFNVGDVFVLLAGWLLGPWLGGLAAGLGSSVADLFLGYTAYAPATFVVKGCVAVVAWAMYAVTKKLLVKDTLDFLPRILAGVVAEIVMVLGYFVFEAVLLELGVAAAANLFGNAVQGICGVIGATLVVSTLYPLPRMRALFPALHLK